MDNPEQEEEKYTNIRQAIRKVFLPLAQVIYDEDPSDIILFCYNYFGNLLQKREYDRNDEKASISENEDKRSSNEDLKGTLQPNIQGSSSEPILSNDDKHREFLTLRETSSWDVPSCHSKLAASLVHCDVADAMSRIGDQLSCVESQPGIETDAKAGDAVTLQNEIEVYKNDSSVEVKTVQEPKNDPNTDEVQNIPSAPYDDEAPNSKKDSSKFAQKNTENPASLNLDSSNISGGITEKEIETKVCNATKVLSPNSSFGFIPHITEYNSEKELTAPHSSEILVKEKTNEQIDEFTKKFSETFQSVAQKFSTAVSNFNEEFQNVKELTDVLQGESEKCESNIDDRFGKGSDTEDDSTNENINELNESDVEVASNENGNLNNEMNDDTCHRKYDADCIKTESICRGEIKPESETLYDSLKFDIPSTDTYEGFQEGKPLNRRESKDSEHQEDDDDDDDEDDKTNSFESFSSVDESWRRRWYDAHPQLENCRRGFLWPQLRQSRFRPDNARAYPRPNIGEGGDVPSHRFRAQDGTLNGNSCNSTQQNLTSASRTEESNDFQISFSSDDISCRVPQGKACRNLSDSFHLSKNASNISQNKSSSCNNQSSENEKQPVEELKTDLKRENSATNVKAKSRSRVTLYEYLHQDVMTKTDFDDQETLSSENDGVEKISQSNNSSNEAAIEIELRSDNSETFDLKSSLIQSSPKSSDTEKQVREAGKKPEIFTSNKEVNETDGKSPGSEQTVASEDHIKVVKGTPSGDEISSAIKKHIKEPNRNHKNAEPGLNSAGGDFSSSRIDENNDRDCELETPGRDGAEEVYCADSTDRNEQNTATRAISAEYLEVIEEDKDKQQDYEDACECLNFTTFSDSDSSNIESDYSEAENK